jgi:L-amino acid N-acyltransferase YncA
VKSDADQLCDILNAIIEIGGTTAFLDPIDPSFFDRDGILSDKVETFAHLAETNGTIHGYQWISPFQGPLCQIATFARPGTAQRGIGTALFPHTVEMAKAAGYTEIDATIRADNTGGLAYYSKMGFIDKDVTRAKPLDDGTLVDRIHKRLKL